VWRKNNRIILKRIIWQLKNLVSKN
jgi:hypothetical protein